MAQKIELKVENRDILGKKVRFLRNKGVVPVHLFGHNLESMALQGEEAVLRKVIAQAGRTRIIDLKVGSDGATHPVMVREVQRNPIKGSLVHVDLYKVDLTQNIKIEVPIVLKGESPALKIRENMLHQDMNTLLIECLPDKMPDRIEVDISPLKEVDDAVRVKDVNLPDVTILNEEDLVIARVSLRPVEVAEQPRAAEAGAEAAAGAAAGTEAKPGAEAKAGAEGKAKPEGKAPAAEKK